MNNMKTENRKKRIENREDSKKLFSINYSLTTKSGFSLVEILVAVSILVGILALVGSFQADVFSLNRIIQAGLQNQSDAKKLVRPFANEVRSSAPSNLGAYPIAESATSTFSFYTDLDGDGLRELVRYFLEGNDFKKGVIKPTGQPLVYDENSEQIIRVIHDVVDTVVFEYYDSNYDGTASSTALTHPVAPAQVRLVKVTMIIDSDPNKPPAPIEITTQVSIRNIKDNL